jgi:hypothetical protein
MDFHFIDVPEVRGFAPAAPALVALESAAPLMEGVKQGFLLPNADRQRNLLSYPKNAAENKAFVDLWSGILSKAGFTPGKNDYRTDLGMSFLEYSGKDGAVVRGFMAEPRLFKPKDPVDLKASMALVSAAVEDAGLPIMASFTSEMEHFLPTYHLYYVTKPGIRPEDTVQVRLLKAEGADASILANAGVRVVQQVDGFFTVFIGPDLGMVTRSSDDRAVVEKRIEEFKAFIVAQGGRFITAVVRELPPGSYRKYEFDLYFFR